MTDLELLAIEIDTIWATDGRGRLVNSRDGRPAPHAVVAVANNEQVSAIGSDVPDELALELSAAIAAAAAPADPASPPACLAICERLLSDRLGPVELSSGPSFLIPTQIAFACATDLWRSDGGHEANLRDRNPERANWSDEEWNLLLDGQFGPWAMASVNDRIIAICHSARLTDRGAEAGAWTHPDFRGQGHAAAVTAAWASLLAASGRHLFYSTSAENLSSQRVAARLKLRPIGWMWRLFPGATRGGTRGPTETRRSCRP